jgi:hypothetical protein
MERMTWRIRGTAHWSLDDDEEVAHQRWSLDSKW